MQAEEGYEKDVRMHRIRWGALADLLTSRCAISTFSTFQLLIMKYLVSSVLQRLMLERNLLKRNKPWQQRP